MNNLTFFWAGSGQFGSVAKGECTLKNGSVIPVAVKTLKNEDIGAKEEVRVIQLCLIQVTWPKQVYKSSTEWSLSVYTMVLPLFIVDAERGSIHDESEPQAYH